MGSYYKQQLNDWKATLDVKADVVFDIGGAQSPIKGMTKSWDVSDYQIIDLEVPHSEAPTPDIAWDMNDDIADQFGLRHESVDRALGGADIVFCLGVFDYVINPNIAMNNLKLLMKDDGYAWVEFPFVYPVHNPVDDEGCRYSEGCIRRLAKQAGLNVEQVIYKRPKPNNQLLTAFYVADGMRAARGVDHNVTGYIFKFTK